MNAFWFSLILGHLPLISNWRLANLSGKGMDAGKPMKAMLLFD
jgi:hypothetical protein